MELQAQHSGEFVAHWGGEGHYQISRGSTTCAVVDLDQRSCTCRRWNLTGIPCSHSMVDIYSKGDDPTKYVDKWYLKDTFKKCYSSVLHGIRTEKFWSKTNMPPLLPPMDVNQAGRPKKLRIKEIGEIPPNARKIARTYEKYSCSKCKQEGHSAKTCEKRSELQAKLKKKIGTQKKSGKSIQEGVTHEVQSDVEVETQPENEGGVLTQEHAETNDPFEWFGNMTNILNTLRFDPDIVERIKAVQCSNQATTSKSAASKMK
ncbi:hypothetical protein LWI29_005602 [Acer saccharum]|uniref:SWIM-type domain-containing protein n=1 Tax=Acer saccharum TaxID=4024 RepID=A0AA39W847_ACESA|nr:hypothetical protein LWI29_005602 [Acer saccharum]